MAGLSDDRDGGGQPRLWVVRHGQTTWSEAGRHTGWTDVPLTDIGRAQARSIGPRLAGVAFAAVVSSPLGRAYETARLAGFGGRVTTDDDLREWNYGADEGRTTAEIRADRPAWSIWRDGVLDGETIEEVAARADRVIERARGRKGDTLCFAHGHVLRILGARWIGLPAVEGSRFALTTATISILGWERETPVIERWNDGLDLG